MYWVGSSGGRVCPSTFPNKQGTPNLDNSNKKEAIFIKVENIYEYSETDIQSSQRVGGGGAFCFVL